MLAEKLEKLKILLVKEQDFAKIMKYFFDSVILDPQFMLAGHSSDDAVVRATFTAVAQALAQQSHGKASQAVEFMLPLQYLEAYQLYHGALRVGDNMGVMFLFRDIDTGLGSLTRMNDGYSHYSRFSCQILNQAGGAAERHGALH